MMFMRGGHLRGSAKVYLVRLQSHNCVAVPWSTNQAFKRAFAPWAPHLYNKLRNSITDIKIHS